MAETAISSTASVVVPRQRQGISLAWLGLLPFFIFAFAFLLFPASIIIVRSFQGDSGELTLSNLSVLTNPSALASYTSSLELSIVTAVAGGLFGFLIAYGVTVGGLPRVIRSSLLSFSAVASVFGGVPLAFAFIATLGRTGLMTALLKSLGLNIYDYGFNLYSFVGLSLTYIYFQFPLMVLIVAPALDGLKREWREASENLGATTVQYWRYVALPVLLPSILGTMILLFGNAFGAYATAYALTSGQVRLVTLDISSAITGDVYSNPAAGYVLSAGMLVIMAISIGLYTFLQRRTERWLR